MQNTPTGRGSHLLTRQAPFRFFVKISQNQTQSRKFCLPARAPASYLACQLLWDVVSSLTKQDTSTLDLPPLSKPIVQGFIGIYRNL